METGRSKRLCFITRSPVDSAPYAEIALPALAEDGWEITIFAPNARKSILRQVRPFACQAFDLTGQGAGSAIKQEAELARVLLSARVGPYDVIYVNSQSLSARAAIVMAGPAFGKRLVYHNPDYYDPFLHPIYFRFEKAFCRKVHLYINNEFHRGYITQTQYRLRCPIVTAPPNLPSVWPIPARSPDRRREMCGGREERQFVLMLHGRYGELRMVPQLFQALALLPSHIRLVMTGGNHRKEEVEALLRELGIADRVVRLPHIGFQELLGYTVNADAGVLLYQNNDLGNFFTAPGRLTEYLACGLPVLATNHTGLENLVLRYGLGECVDSTKPEKIAAGLKALAADCKSGRYPRGRMRGIFLERFAFDHWEPMIVESFNALFSGDRPAGSGSPPFPWLPNP